MSSSNRGMQDPTVENFIWKKKSKWKELLRIRLLE